MNTGIDKKLFFSMTLDFLEVYLPQGHESSKTVKAYRDGLTVFRRYLSDVRKISIKDFQFGQCTFDLVLDYRNWLIDVKKRKPSTVNNRLAALKAYLHYAAAKEIAIQQIHMSIAEVPFLRVPKVVRPIIENVDTLKALLTAPPNTWIGCRDTMILSILFDTMIRADELIQLDLKDVQIEGETPFLFIHGKGNKERTVPVSPQLVLLIKDYLARFHADDSDRSQPLLYATIHGERHRMSERNIERIVKKYADLTRENHPDLPDPVYPHMFRRTRGTGLYRDGVAVEAIAVAMGHASIQTTKDHYAFPSIEQKKEVMSKGDGLVISKKETKKEWPDDDNEFAKLCGLR